MTAVLSTYRISAVRSGDKLEIRGPYNEQLQEFYSSLPAAAWDRLRACWTCDITPAACWRLTSQAPCDVEADEAVMEIGRLFYEPVLRPQPEAQPALQRGTAWAHQAAAYSFALNRDASLLAMWMGTGKSRVTVNLADNWGVRSALIICPVAVRGVWRRELAKHSPREWLVTVLESGTVKKKVAAAIVDSKRAEARCLPHAVVVNYETAWRDPFALWAIRKGWDLVVCDESHRIKSAGAEVSKFCGKLGRTAKRRLALSGTPMAHSPLDLFGQFRFLDRGVFGTSYHRFRSYFAVSGPFGADHIVGFRNQDELAQRMALLTFEVGADVLDLPPAQHIDVPVTLEPKTLRAYREMEEDLITQVDTGEVTAANGLVKLLRLQQLTSGFIQADDAEEPEVLSGEKREALADLLTDLNEPVVVCCRFRHDLDQVRHVVESLGRRYGELSGRDHSGLTPTAEMSPDVDVLGVQIQAGGVGVSLVRARVAIIWSVGFSLGEYEQFLARTHRPGQTRAVVYYHLVAEKTVDRAVYSALQKKRDVIESVLGYLRGDSECPQ